MYKSNSLFDQEMDRYDNMASGEISEGYHSADKYSGNASDNYSGNPSSEYKKNEGHEESKKEKSEFERKIEDNLPKQEKKEDEKNQDNIVINKVAEEIRGSMQQETKKINKNSISARSIEDAINKAIQDEKDVIHL
ncbi:MAG: hypothetical protein ABIJ08_04565 [Nanoarchaeota archaeon]